MTKKILALLLAFAMMLALVACGGNAAQNNDAAQNNAADTGANNETAGNAADDAQDATQNAPEEDEQDAPAEETPAPDEDAVPALNRADFTLKNVGDSFRLEVENLPEGAAVTWAISDESVATIAEDGTVTAVAAGTATVTAVIEGSDAVFACIVRVTAEESGESQSGKSLSAFYADVMGKYELPMGLMEVNEPEMIGNYFADLTDIATKQMLVCLTMMGPMNGEIVAVEVSNSSDVAAVEKILNDRVNYMIESGAFYPETIETWEKNSRVVSAGNFVLLVTSASCDDIVADFKAFAK